MKKLLVLGLVLCLAAVALGDWDVTVRLESAGKNTLVIGTDVLLGQVIVVDLLADTVCAGITGIDFLNTSQTINAVGSWVGFPSGYDLVNGTLTPAGGGLGADIMRASGMSPEVAANTVLYSFNATVSGPGTLELFMGPGDTFYLGYLPCAYPNILLQPLNIIPEPVTMALLALGGLLLLRRR